VSLGGRSGTDDDVLPVFVAQELVAQCVDLVRAADTLEIGGILIGRMRRDTAAGLFLEISAQIPAEHSEQQEMAVTFTDRTWAAARDTLAKRKSDESILGWFHSHPDFCANCTHEKRADCALNGIFFSKTDVSLHRTMFPRAWHVGLLLSNRPAGIIPALFGWERGEVKARPFYLLAPPAQVPDPALLEALGSWGESETQALATVGGDERGTH
jgi:proteasome lid subunit RPN8/RPN11